MPVIHPTLPADGDDAIVEPYNIAIQAILGVLNGSVDADNIADAAVTTSKLHDAAVTNTKVADNSVDIGAKASVFDGWVKVTDTWTYASPTTVTVPTDATTKYVVGDSIKFTNNSAVQYFKIITLTATVMTLKAQGSSSITNSAITNIYYSKVATPQGMPTTGNDWYEELGRTTLTVAGDTITVQNLPQRKYLRILVLTVATAGVTHQNLRLNNDSGANYATSVVRNNSGTPGMLDGVSQTAFNTQNLDTISGGVSQSTFDLINLSSANKLITGMTACDTGSTAAGTRTEPLFFTGKWVATSVVINRVDVLNTGAGDFAIGSEVIVLGHD